MNQKSLILSIPVMLAVLLLGGWFLFREPKSAPESQSTPVAEENTSKNAGNLQPPANIDTSIDTSNWKTYRNEEYGFEVKYPAEWAIPKQENESVFFGPVEPDMRPVLEVSIKSGEIKEWIQNLETNQSSPYTKILSQESYTIGSSTGTKVVYSTDIGLNNETILLQMDNGNLIAFSFSVVENTSLYFEKIIQTFHILNWKTYRNEALKLSFKYPDTFRLDESIRDDGHVVSVMEYDENAMDLSKKPTPGYFSPISIYSWKDINNPYLKGGEWVDQKKYKNFQEFLADDEHTFIRVTSELNVDGAKAYFLSMPGDIGYEAVMFEYANKYYRISFPWTQKSLDENIKKEFISSIKLLK